MSSEFPHVQELASRICERLFGIPEFRAKYGARAQPHIVALFHTCPPDLRPLASRLLLHLQLVDCGSTGVSSSSASAASASSSLFGSSHRASSARLASSL
jgi:hypothetical protein